MSTQAKNHGNPSLGDIVRTTAVMSAVVLVLAGIAWWFSIEPDEQQKVDYESVLVSARRDASFALLAPQTLPSGWYANSVRYEPGEKGRWHLGVVTRDGDYIGLEQTAIGPRRAVAQFAADTKAKGTIEVGGYSWQLRKSAKTETTLVRRTEGITILVTGTAPQNVLEAYVAGLSSS